MEGTQAHLRNAGFSHLCIVRHKEMGYAAEFLYLHMQKNTCMITYLTENINARLLADRRIVAVNKRVF